MDPYEDYPYPIRRKPPGTYHKSSNAYMTPPNLEQPQFAYQQQNPYYQDTQPPYAASPYNEPTLYDYGYNYAGNEPISDLPPYGGDPSRGRSHRRNRSRDKQHRPHADPHHRYFDDDDSSIEYEVRKVRRPLPPHRVTSYLPNYQSTRSHHKSSSKRIASHGRYDCARGHSRRRRSEYHPSSGNHSSLKPAHDPDRYEKDSFHRERVPIAEMEDELRKFKNGPATHQDYQDVVNLWKSGSKESAWRLIQSIQAHPDARHKKLEAKGSKKHRHKSR